MFRRTPLVGPSFTLLRGPIFSGERYRRIHPSIHSFNQSPDHYSSVRHTSLSVTDLPAAKRILFARGSGGFSYRALGGNALSCAGKGAGLTPDRGPGASWLHGELYIGVDDVKV